MNPNPACLINIFLAFLALGFYIIGSYRFYKNQKGYLLILGLAIAIDLITALLASLRITPTTQIPGAETVPWYSLLFNVHIALSTFGFVGFIILFLYLTVIRDEKRFSSLRRWQFKILLPVWVIGEGIALTNALSKYFFQVRIFELL
jgi:hypothetical protein